VIAPAPECSDEPPTLIPMPIYYGNEVLQLILSTIQQLTTATEPSCRPCVLNYYIPMTRIRRKKNHILRPSQCFNATINTYKTSPIVECGKLHPPGCPRKRSVKRKFGTDITESTINGVIEAILGGSLTHFKCSKCQIWLCIQGSCWERYHHSIGVNW
jgi:hypothetical protein